MANQRAASGHILDVFEERARKGDGQFAIAYALMQMSYSNAELAKMVGRLGFDCAEHPGAFEFIGMQMEEIVKKLGPFEVSATVDIND